MTSAIITNGAQRHDDVLATNAATLQQHAAQELVQQTNALLLTH